MVPLLAKSSKRHFLILPKEKRKAKVHEFINLCQGGMSVKEYSLKFIKLSKYSSSLASNDRDEMSHYVMSVSEELEDECHASMLHKNMDLSRLMVHAQQVEESHLRKKNREANKPSSFESVVILRVGLTLKTSLSTRRGFRTKFLKIPPRLAMIGCVTLNIKYGEMLIHQKKDQLVESVVETCG